MVGAWNNMEFHRKIVIEGINRVSGFIRAELYVRGSEGQRRAEQPHEASPPSPCPSFRWERDCPQSEPKVFDSGQDKVTMFS